MKRFNFKKILMLFALAIIVQNGAVIATSIDGNTSAYTADGEVTPCSDVPALDESYD